MAGESSRQQEDDVIVNVSESTPLLDEVNGSKKNKGKDRETRIRHGRGPIYASNLADDDYVESQSSGCRGFLIVAVIFLAVIGLAIGAVTLLSPRMTEEISAQQAVIVTLDDAELVQIRSDGVEMRIQGHAGLDINRIKKKWVYAMVELGTFVFRTVETQPSDMHVFGVFNGTETDLGYFEMPRVAIPVYDAENLTAISASTTFFVLDTKALAAFAEQAVFGKRIMGKVKGQVKLKAGLLPVTIPNMEIPLELEGMGGMPKVKIEKLAFPGDHPDGGIAIEAEASIKNPTQLSANIGNVDFAIYLPGNNSEDFLMATARAENVTMEPYAPINIVLHGHALPINKTTAGENKANEAVDRFMASYLRGKDTEVLVRGSPFNETNGQPLWIRDALRRVTIPMTFPGAPQNEFVTDIKIRDLKFRLGEGSPLATGWVSGHLHLPENMNFSLDVNALRPDVFVFNGSLKDSTSKKFGRMVVEALIPATTFQRKNETIVEAHMVDVPMKILDGGVFQDFLTKLLFEGEGRIGLDGISDAVVKTGLGELRLNELPISGEFDVNGIL